MTYENIKVNSVPSITWNWLKSNNDTVSVKADFTIKNADIKALPKGVTISNQKAPDSIPQIQSGTFNRSNPKVKDNRKPDGSIAEKREYQKLTDGKHPLIELMDKVDPNGQYITIEGKLDQPLILNYDFQNSSISRQVIHAKAGSQSTVIFIYTGDADTSLFQTKVYAEANSSINIVKVQLLGNSTLQLDDTGITADDSAKTQFTLIELGGQHIDSGLHVNLNGRESQFNANVAYICKDKQYLDMNHTVYHYGKKTVCDMQVHGTIKDDASKVYRGTLDFKNGCRGANGNEFEETLILSPTTMNKSFPIILCDEDDIQGEHGSTIGKLGSDLLFYMQTRGICKEAAEKIMARARVQAVMDTIPDEETKTLINSYLDKNEEE